MNRIGTWGQDGDAVVGDVRIYPWSNHRGATEIHGRRNVCQPFPSLGRRKGNEGRQNRNRRQVHETGPQTQKRVVVTPRMS